MKVKSQHNELSLPQPAINREQRSHKQLQQQKNKTNDRNRMNRSHETTDHI
jgi:hypothetical protein